MRIESNFKTTSVLSGPFSRLSITPKLRQGKTQLFKRCGQWISSDLASFRKLKPESFTLSLGGATLCYKFDRYRNITDVFRTKQRCSLYGVPKDMQIDPGEL